MFQELSACKILCICNYHYLQNYTLSLVFTIVLFSEVKGLKKQSSEKDLGFLRIGSLNVRVKKTTEAFSNFLGVGGGSVISPNENSSDKILKGWGSADNVNQENEMPAPKGYLVKKKSKRPLEHSSGVQSTPTTPKQATRSSIHRFSTNDSDSDTAAGFDSQWKN